MASILLIDDDAANREPAGHLLRLAGYDVLRAASGSDGLELLDNCPIDLILLDVRMPEMDGFTFLQKLRENEQHKKLPVVVMTGLNDDQTLDRLRQSDVKSYLIKSRFSGQRLLDVVREQLVG